MWQTTKNQQYRKRHTSIMKKITLLIILLPILTGCTSSRQIAISSIEDINTENDSALPFINFDQQRSIHTGGLLPHYSIGQMYAPPSSWSSFSPSKYVAISDKPYYIKKEGRRGVITEVPLDAYASMNEKEQDKVRLGTKSQIVRATYKCTATPEEITSVVTQLSALKEKAQDYLNTRLDVAITRSHIAEKEKKEAEIQTIPDDKKSARIAELNKLIGSKTELSLRKVVSDSKLELAKAESSSINSVSKGNLIIAKWNSESSKEFLTYLSSMLKLDFSRKENKSGYVILKGVRVSSLLLGTDIHHESYSTTLNWNRPVVTALWQTESAVAVADLVIEEEFKAKLEATYDQLKQLEKTLRDLEKIEIEATYKTLQKSTNNSWINSPTIEVEDMEWTSIYQKMNESENDNWATFYAILSNHSDLKEKVNGGKWQKLKAISNYVNPF
jgi:hypothetical protein